MKLLKLIDPRFTAALGKLTAQEMPLKIALRLKNIVTRIEEESGRFEASRKEALMRHGTHGEDGELLLDADSNVRFSTDGLRAFLEELNTIGNTEIDIGTISASELGDYLVLTVDDVRALDGLLTE